MEKQLVETQYRGWVILNRARGNMWSVFVSTRDADNRLFEGYEDISQYRDPDDALAAGKWLIDAIVEKDKYFSPN